MPTAWASMMTTSSVRTEARFSQNSSTFETVAYSATTMSMAEASATNGGCAMPRMGAPRSYPATWVSNQSSIRVIRSTRRSIRPVAWIPWNSSG